MTEILQTSLVIALFCVSWDILLTYEPNEPKRNQMLLYWLRKPFVLHENEVFNDIDKYIKFSNECRQIDIDDHNKRSFNSEEERVSSFENLIYIHDQARDNGIENIKNRLAMHFWFKPILTCKYCFPSFYGTIIFIMLHGFHVEQWATWLLSIVCSVILVGVISGIHEKLIK